MKFYTTPEEMLYEEIHSIAEEKALEKNFRATFPAEDYKLWLEVYSETYQMRRKYVQGMGTFLFFSQKGSTKFHEFILDKVIRKVQNNHIKYRRGQIRKGADLFVYDERGTKYAIELETSLLHSPESRPRLKHRIQDYKGTTIILTLNTTDKRKYARSELPYLYSRIKILTIEEMVDVFTKNTLDRSRAHKLARARSKTKN